MFHNMHHYSHVVAASPSPAHVLLMLSLHRVLSFGSSEHSISLSFELYLYILVIPAYFLYAMCQPLENRCFPSVVPTMYAQGMHRWHDRRRAAVTETPTGGRSRSCCQTALLQLQWDLLAQSACLMLSNFNENNHEVHPNNVKRNKECTLCLHVCVMLSWQNVY